MDITQVWDETNGTADWAISMGDLLVGSDLRTAVVISLFTDARAPASYTPGANDPRGWWGDTYSPTPWGSLLWTLSRSGISDRQGLLLSAQDMCKNALQWMLTDGVAQAVNVATEFATSTAMVIAVSILEPGANSPTVFKFSWAWAQLGL